MIVAYVQLSRKIIYIYTMNQEEAMEKGMQWVSGRGLADQISCLSVLKMALEEFLEPTNALYYWRSYHLGVRAVDTSAPAARARKEYQYDFPIGPQPRKAKGKRKSKEKLAGLPSLFGGNIDVVSRNLPDL